LTLARSSNLAEHSDDAGEEEEVSPEVKFTQRKQQTEEDKAVLKQGRQNLRAEISSRQAKITVSSSHNLDMDKMQDLLLAPTLSFDWEGKQSDDEEEVLEVDVPETETHSSKRDMFKEQLHRSASFHQAKGLSHRGRTKSNLNLSFNTSKSFTSVPAPPTPELNSEATQKRLVRTDSELPKIIGVTTMTPEAAVESEKVPPSALWEVLESEATATSAKVVGDESAAMQVDLPSASADATTSEADKSHAPEQPNGSVASTVQEVPVEQQNVDMPDASEQKATPSEPATASESLEKFLLGESLDDPALIQERRDTPASITEPSNLPSETLSEDWDGITPTAMWSARVDSFDSGKHEDISPTAPFVPKAAADQSVEISQTQAFVPKVTADQQVDISQTQPFVPKAAAACQVDISQTQPFVANDAPQQTLQQKLEISQTQPFVSKAADRQVDISPTAPFINNDPPQRATSSPTESATVAHASQAGISPTAPATRFTQQKESSMTDPFAQPGAPPQASATMPSAERPVPSPSRPLRRSATLISEDSLSESDDGALGEGEEHAVRQNPKQRQREREWLKHKRQAARKEAKEGVEMIKRRKIGSVDDHHSSVLSTQDRSRYKEVVEAHTVKALAGGSEASRLMRGSDSLDDAAVFGGFRGGMGGIQKKKSFFMK